MTLSACACAGTALTALTAAPPTMPLTALMATLPSTPAATLRGRCFAFVFCAVFVLCAAFATSAGAVFALTTFALSLLTLLLFVVFAEAALTDFVVFAELFALLEVLTGTASCASSSNFFVIFFIIRSFKIC